MFGNCWSLETGSAVQTDLEVDIYDQVDLELMNLLLSLPCYRHGPPGQVDSFLLLLLRGKHKESLASKAPCVEAFIKLDI